MVKEKPVDPNLNRTETLCSGHTSNVHAQPIDYGGNLDWSLNDQFYVLTSFYWTYIISQILGGTLAQKFGTKKVFGWTMFVASVCNVCIPFVSNLSYIAVVILQSAHGFAQGLTWPALYAAIGVWIPINERSRFVTCFQGLSLGIMSANLISGFIIVKFGWVYVFYCSGVCGLVNTLAWYLLMYDKPENHPRISKQELKYIQENREQCLHSEKNIPWFSILKSVPVWAIGVAAFGRMWSTTFLTIYGPLYLKTVIGLPVDMNGLWMAVSSLVAFLSALFFSYVSDRLVTYKVMKIVYNRKLFVLIGLVVPGFLTLSMGYIKCNIPLIIGIWLLNQSFFVANFQGSMTNIVDIAPTYTGPVTCVVQVILLTATLLCPVVIKTFLQNESNLQSWKNIFDVNSSVAFCSCIFYVLFASGKVQKWDLAKNSRNLSNCKAASSFLKDEEVKD
ncbi:hypothetical protein FQR65_LT05465 [Abscondita terminalis]|nr:hypothetical protein FQR65_LT05465 [Abscondita terminalis]